jgi:hypothetical protein
VTRNRNYGDRKPGNFLDRLYMAELAQQLGRSTDEDDALLAGHARRWKSGDIDADALAPFAAALNGKIDDNGFIVSADVTVRVDPGAPDYFYIYGEHAFASLSAAKKHVRERLALVAPVAPDDTVRREAALRLWREARPAAGTLVEDYLRSRGITLPATSLKSR